MLQKPNKNDLWFLAQFAGSHTVIVWTAGNLSLC